MTPRTPGFPMTPRTPAFLNQPTALGAGYGTSGPILSPLGPHPAGHPPAGPAMSLATITVSPCAAHISGEQTNKRWKVLILGCGMYGLAWSR